MPNHDMSVKVEPDAGKKGEKPMKICWGLLFYS